MQQTILIIEDDADIAESLEYNFKREGFKTIVAESGEKGFRLALDETVSPALIILDLMLPGMNGMDVCRKLRRDPVTEKIPVVMLTAKAAEADKVAGLEMGADDYVVKPFSFKELIARIRAVLRRSESEPQETSYADGRLTVDFNDMRVECLGTAIKMTKKEFSLLQNLIASSGRVATRQQLLDNVWGYSYFGDSRTLDVHIRRLRQKLGDCGGCIETVVGVGYRFTGCQEPK
jgi:two-component system, OmpR family, alkaline phosphatase synthesis response regulator PhoP